MTVTTTVGRRGLLAGAGAAAAGTVIAGSAAAAVDPAQPKPLAPLDRGEAAGPVAYRGTILYFKEDPDYVIEQPQSVMVFHEDGFLGIDVNGKVIETGPWPMTGAQKTVYADRVVDYSGKVIMPGFLDCHVHYVQMDVIAGYGDQILQWLEKYIFPGESKYQDINFAREVAGFFLDTMLKCGTTTALVWSSTPRESVDAFFEEAQKRNMRMITGAVVQDESLWKGNQNDVSIPAAMQKTKDLIQKWHGIDRLLYAVTPRFAPSCSWGMLTMCRDVLDEYKTKGVDVWFQTHLSENLEEESRVRVKFKNDPPGILRTYAQSYKEAGLLRERALYAHSVEINQGDREIMAQGGASIGHSPTSNEFLGSGYFNPWEAQKTGVRFGYGTDCGGGTHYSMLHTAGAAYKAAALRARQYIPSDRLPALTWPEGPIEPKDWPAQNYNEFSNKYPKVTAWQALYRLTLGGARALYLDKPGEFVDPRDASKKVTYGGIGTFNKGAEADFIVLTLAPTAVVDRRIKAVQKHPMKKPSANGEPPQIDTSITRTMLDMWHEKLFALMIMSDERATYATYIMGKLAYHIEHGVYRPQVREPIGTFEVSPSPAP